MPIGCWGFVQTFSNHQCDHQEPVSSMTATKPDLPEKKDKKVLKEIFRKLTDKCR